MAVGHRAGWIIREMRFTTDLDQVRREDMEKVNLWLYSPHVCGNWMRTASERQTKDL